MRRAEGREKPRHTRACCGSRSAALDLAGVPAKLEHRGQRKSVYESLMLLFGRSRRHRDSYAVTSSNDTVIDIPPRFTLISRFARSTFCTATRCLYRGKYTYV